MKKILFLWGLFTFLSLNALDNQSDIKGVIVREFSSSELKTAQIDAGVGEPHAIYFDYEGRLAICDAMNYRIAKFNNTFQVVDSILIDKYTFYSPMSYNYEDDKNIYQFSKYGLLILKKNNDELIDIAMPHLSQEFRYNHGIFINNTYINWTKDNKIYSIQEPHGDDYRKNNLKLKGDEKTMELLRREHFSSKGYTIDDKKRIFLNGELITRSFPVFWYYWNDKSVVLKTNGKIRNPSKMNSTRYLGKDDDGNYVWHKGSIVMVFNENGQMVYHYFSSDMREGVFAQKDGDIYILKNKEYPMKLLKIEKQW